MIFRTGSGVRRVTPSSELRQRATNSSAGPGECRSWVQPDVEGGVNEFDDIVQEFLVESYENLDQLDRDLIALEQDPGARDRIASIFRTIHTIKGTSGFLAFTRLGQLTHAGDSLLSRLRDGAQVLARRATDVLLCMIDAVRELLAHIERDGTEGDVETQSVIDAVNACIAGEDVPLPAPKGAADAAPEPAAEPTAGTAAGTAPEEPAA